MKNAYIIVLINIFMIFVIFMVAIQLKQTHKTDNSMVNAEI